MWAYNREHLGVIRAHIASPLRPQGRLKNKWKLYKLPAAALKAANRRRALKSIDRLLMSA